VVLRHLEQHGRLAKVAWIRQTFPSLVDAEGMLHEIMTAAYGTDYRYNGNDHIFRLPGGGTLVLGILTGPLDYRRWQGKSATLLVFDEAGHWASPDLLDRMRSNLRGPAGVPLRCVYCANPGDPGHAWLMRRHATRAPWEPYAEQDTGATTVHCPGTFLDNPYLDHGEYARNLRAAAAGDAGLLAAWLSGDWTKAQAGAFFVSVLTDSVMFGPWRPDEWPVQDRQGFRFYLAGDFGTSAPSVWYMAAESDGAEGPDGRYYPRGSILLIDELAISDPSDPSKGLNWTIPRQAEALCELAERWGMERPEGAADDACFSDHGHSSGSIAMEFQSEGVHLERARKGGRVQGWERLRTLMSQAGKPDQPGFYVTRSASYFWETVPYLPRDPRHPQDVDSRAVDHGADAARYAVTYEPHEVGDAEGWW
jgi:hypothetical protein